MTESVQIALIANITTIVVLILSRVMSHLEHKKTEAKVTDTNKKVTQIMNGTHPEGELNPIKEIKPHGSKSPNNR